MSAAARPEISVILVTERFDTVRRTVACLLAQTVRDRVELVLVTEAAARLGAIDDLSAFAGAQVVEVGAREMALLHPARVAGVRAARAPVVVFGETHSYPEPEYCGRLLAALRAGGWAAAGPGMLNANPESALAWSALLLDYGAWLAGGEGGPCFHVAGSNGAYRREILLAYGERLTHLMRADTVLTAQLHADGHRFVFEPAARTRHLNVSKAGSFVVERFAAGREFAAARVAEASRAHRFARALGSPLIPAVRLVRIARHLRRIESAARPQLRILPALVAALAISAAGELCGYLFGSSARGARRLAEIEIYRERHVAGWRPPGAQPERA